MTVTAERIDAIRFRMDEAAHHLGRIIELGHMAASEGPDGLLRRYVRDAYEDSKAGLATCLAKFDEPSSAVSLDQVQGFAVENQANELNRKLGYLQDLARSLAWPPVRRQGGEGVVEWSDEQKDVLRQELLATLKAARDLLAAMP